MAAHLFSKSNSKNLCFPILKFGGYMRLQSTKPCNPQLNKTKEYIKSFFLNSHKIIKMIVEIFLGKPKKIKTASQIG